MTDVKKIPEGYHTVTPYMVIKNAKNALTFYQNAFNAKVLMQMPGKDGLIMHAEMQVGDSKIMLTDEMPGQDAKSPESYGGSPMSLMLYVEDVDKLFKQATEAGAHVVRPVSNQFYGDRAGTLKDPFGHIWTLSTHVENVSMDEMKRRMEKMQASSSSQTSAP